MSGNNESQYSFYQTSDPLSLFCRSSPSPSNLQRAMAEYSSCIHLSQDAVTKAMRKVKDLRSNSNAKLQRNLFQCVDCDFTAEFRSKRLKDHISASGHGLILRMNDPHELYCSSCCDFQFSSVFDRYCKHKRSKSSLLQPKGSKRTVDGGIVCGQAKGLCNMGATCFMSAVLQVLMKNSVLMCCDQLQNPVERCSTLLHRTTSNDASSRQSGDSNGASTPQSSLPSCIYCEFKKLSTEACRAGSGDTLIPAHLLYAVWSELDYMAGYQQQDAHEFLIAFLDGLDKHLKLNHQSSPLSHHPHGLSITLPSVASYPHDILGPPNDVSPPVRKSPRSESKHRSFTLGSTTPAMLRRSNSDNEPSSNGSVTFIPRVAEVLDVFHGALQSRLTCQECGHESSKSETFLDLNLSLTRTHAAPANSMAVDAPLISPIADSETVPGAAEFRLLDTVTVAQLGSGSATPAAVDDAFTATKRTRGRAMKNTKKAADATIVNSITTTTIVTSEEDMTSFDDAAMVVSAGDVPAAHNGEWEAQTDTGDEEDEGGVAPLTLADCMRSFTAVETLGEKIFCSCCGKKQDTQKQFSISTPPNVLILHLKRFDMLTDTKITTKVEIELNNWNIKEFTSMSQDSPATGATTDPSLFSPGAKGASWFGQGNGSGGGTASGDSETLYDLQGLVSHSGTLHGGHYIAYALDQGVSVTGKPGKRQWIRCDDETVTVVPEEEVREAEAYVLFYVKKKFLSF